MRATRTHAASTPHERGFTLVELMVGLVLGLLTVLVITQVLAAAEGKKRTVSMGADAQVNGALALYTLQREVQAAGYGAATSPAALGCTIKGKYTNGSVMPATSADVSMTLAPIVITNGTNGAPDQITVLQSQTAQFSAPIRITETHDASLGYFVVQSSLGVAVGDLMVAVPTTPSATDTCTIFAATAVAQTPTRILHGADGSTGWNSAIPWPESPAKYEGAVVTEKLAKSYLLNLGTLTQRTYSVSAAHDLQVTATTSKSVNSAAADLYPQIVNLQAMYGKDTDADGMVDRWDTTTPTTQADWVKVLAIRVAVVARSNQYEKDVVTTAGNSPQWDIGASDATDATTAACPGSNSGNKCIALKIDNVTDWGHYRYKVYDAVIPLRNMLWNS